MGHDDLERRRELNWGAHPPVDEDGWPAGTEPLRDPAWTVHFEGRDRVGCFTVRAPDRPSAEHVAATSVREDERVTRVDWGDTTKGGAGTARK